MENVNDESTLFLFSIYVPVGLDIATFVVCVEGDEVAKTKINDWNALKLISTAHMEGFM